MVRAHSSVLTEHDHWSSSKFVHARGAFVRGPAAGIAPYGFGADRCAKPVGELAASVALFCLRPVSVLVGFPEPACCFLGGSRLVICWFLGILSQIGLEKFAFEWQTSAPCVSGVSA